MKIVGRIAVSLTPGMYIDINIPIVTGKGNIPNGVVPSDITEKTVNGYTVDVIRGFYVENPYIGHLEESPLGIGVPLKPTVRYIQDKPFPNRITFEGVKDQQMVVDIVAAPIHDHSSIAQGGPAYGTYFSDYEQEPETN